MSDLANRQTRRVVKPTTAPTPAATKLRSFDDTLDIPCYAPGDLPEGAALADSACQLTIVKGGAPVARQIFLTELVTIGRAPGCDLRLDDGAASRLHARLERGELIDENSANGTWLNGTQVERRPLKDGDVIRIGEHELVFHLAEGGMPAAVVNAPRLEGDAVHFALGEKTLKIGPDRPARGAAAPAKAPPQRGYLFVGGDTSRLKRRALQFAVNRDDFMIGADPGCDLELTGFRMPKVVAFILRGPAGFSLAPFPRWPLKVELQGVAVSRPLPLEDGDKVTIGGLELTFRLGSE
ncbi:MAG: FHA domain-containing protein [Planctomycetota bacterium]